MSLRLRSEDACLLKRGLLLDDTESHAEPKRALRDYGAAGAAGMAGIPGRALIAAFVTHAVALATALAYASALVPDVGTDAASFVVAAENFVVAAVAHATSLHAQASFS